MLYKVLGSGLLLLASGYVALSVRRFEHRRLRVLDGYISLIYYIKGQIDCYAMPLTDILSRVDPGVVSDCLGLESTGVFSFDTVGPGGEPPLPAMVRESRLYLQPETERLLSGFAGELGSVYRAEQVSRCDYYIQALTEERRKLYETMPARLRTCSTLCLCCAVGAAVLLW
jgi:hypothetical protein